jgi:hypothetical protein
MEPAHAPGDYLVNHGSVFLTVDLLTRDSPNRGTVIFTLTFSVKGSMPLF